jgi:hypothetical protein
VNRLLASGVPVTATPSGFFAPSSSAATRTLRALVDAKGVPIRAASSVPNGEPVARPRIGLWDQYGGSMPSGWIRWLFEQFEFPFEVVYAKRLDQGNLNQQFDALVFPDGAIPSAATLERSEGRQDPEPPADLPAELRDRLGRITPGRTIPALRGFLEAGGRIVTIGSSTALARHLGLPIESHLVERLPNGTVRPIPRERFYVPASLLEVRVDSTVPAAFGMRSRAIVLFDESPVFRLLPDAAGQGIRAVAWYDSAEPLRSGWAWGQTYLEGGVAAIEARIGKGTLYLFGPEITYRAQPHGTFRFLFNGVLGR